MAGLEEAIFGADEGFPEEFSSMSAEDIGRRCVIRGRAGGRRGAGRRAERHSRQLLPAAQDAAIRE